MGGERTFKKIRKEADRKRGAMAKRARPAVVRLRWVGGEEDRLWHAQLQPERALQQLGQVEEGTEAVPQRGAVLLEAL